MAYFEENSEAMLQLEAMVDKVGVANVLHALGHICAAKAEHLESNWQDGTAAKVWSRAGNFLDNIAPFNKSISLLRNFYKD